MKAPQKLVMGTRGSALALIQTALVTDALCRAHPALVVERKIITTKGDKDQSPIPLDTVGKAWFTEEIDAALVRGDIDLAVHSLKDIPPEKAPGLAVVPVLPRADAADVLISRTGAHLADLPHGAKIGTDSIRRKALLVAERRDLNVVPLRGNVDTRLKKLDAGEYDAIVLAAAGLVRLGRADRITERLDPARFIPAPGQGMLAFEVKNEREDVKALLRAIVDEGSVRTVEAEQAFSDRIGGGCKLPVGCYAELRGGEIVLNAMLGSMDGLRVARASAHGPVEEGTALARTLADELLKSPVAQGTLR